MTTTGTCSMKTWIYCLATDTAMLNYRKDRRSSNFRLAIYRHCWVYSTYLRNNENICNISVVTVHADDQSTGKSADPLMAAFEPCSFNTLRLRLNGRYDPDDMLKCIFLNGTISISIKSSLKYVPKGTINNIPVLVQIMTFRRSGYKPLSELMMG